MVSDAKAAGAKKPRKTAASSKKTAAAKPKSSKTPSKSKKAGSTTTKGKKKQQQQEPAAVDTPPAPALPVKKLQIPAKIAPAQPMSLEVAREKSIAFARSLPGHLVSAVRTILEWCVISVTDPARVRSAVRSLWGSIKHEAAFYWTGTKLLVADATTAGGLVNRVLSGHSLTRRERQQLLRTSTDLLRVVPFSVFVLIPFMELLLPVALKLFPNMLPSTFQTSLKKEEDMKRQLQLRLDLASFLQDTTEEMAKSINKRAEGGSQSATQLLSLIDRVRGGEEVDQQDVLSMAGLFKDELTLSNISRPQLVTMCRYMGATPYGSDEFLRFQLRSQVRKIKADDQLILWEGVDSLNLDELKQANQERGMRATGLGKARLRKQLAQWLDLSINKQVPASLLILSQAFSIASTGPRATPETIISDTISSLDEEVVAEAVLEGAAENMDAAELQSMRLEALHYQNELIADEREEREERMKQHTEEGEGEAALEDPVAAAAAAAAAAEESSVAATTPTAAAKADEAPAAAEAAADAATELEAGAEPEAEAELEAEAAKMTAAELEALEVLASASSVGKERERLELMKVKAQHSDREVRLADEGSSTAGAVQAKVAAMIKKLEAEVAQVDVEIGDKLKVLDRDNDGVISTEELFIAVRDVLSSHNEDSQAAAVVRALDTDQDGKVSLAALVKFAKKRKQMEEEATTTK